MLKIRAFTLIELMMVTLIFTVLFAALLTVLATSDRSWRAGQDKLAEQQEARRALDGFAKLIRQSNPDWVISGLHYPVSISSLNSRIDFYQPVFDSGGGITTLEKVTFKLNPSDATQLLGKVGTQNSTVVANNVKEVIFGAGCAGCVAFNCSSVASDCPVVVMQIKTEKAAEFTLGSRITLRNNNVGLSSEVVVEEPQEGEF